MFHIQAKPKEDVLSATRNNLECAPRVSRSEFKIEVTLFKQDGWEKSKIGPEVDPIEPEE